MAVYQSTSQGSQRVLEPRVAANPQDAVTILDVNRAIRDAIVNLKATDVDGVATLGDIQSVQQAVESWPKIERGLATNWNAAESNDFEWIYTEVVFQKPFLDRPIVLVEFQDSFFSDYTTHPALRITTTGFTVYFSALKPYFGNQGFPPFTKFIELANAYNWKLSWVAFET